MRCFASRLVKVAVAFVMLFAVAGCSGQPLSTREKGTGIGASLPFPRIGGISLQADAFGVGGSSITALIFFRSF